MTIKEFINNFNINNPDWSELPVEFPDCDLSQLSSEEIGKFSSIKALWQLNQASQLKEESRVWQDPEGYCYLVQWSNAVLLRYLIRKLTDNLPKSEYRRKSQLDDAGRSVVRNLEEGYKRATTSEYLDFVGYSQGSLEEAKGDIRELTEDGFLKSKPGSNLAGLGINLGEFNKALKEDRGKYRRVEETKGEVKDGKGILGEAEGVVEGDRIRIGSGLEETKGEVEEGKISDKRGLWDYHPLEILYPPLKNIKPDDLSYEMFFELINKTDYLLRRLVESLEKKLAQDKKYYQVGQARIRDKFKKR